MQICVVAIYPAASLLLLRTRPHMVPLLCRVAWRKTAVRNPSGKTYRPAKECTVGQRRASTLSNCGNNYSLIFSTYCDHLRLSHKRQSCTSHILLIMAEVIRRRVCCLTSLPNILERSGLETTNSEEFIEIARGFAYNPFAIPEKV